MSTPSPTNVPGEERTPSPAPYTPYPQYVPYAPGAPQTPTPPRPKTNNTAVIIAVVALVVLVPVLLCVGAAIVAGTAFFVTSGLTEQTDTNQFKFAVPANPAITISNTAGQITVTKGAVQQVTVVATKHARASSSDSARNLLGNMTVTAAATSDGARITATTAANSLANRQWVNLRVTVPETSNLTVTMNGGTVSIAAITGKLDLTTNAGTVDLRDMTVRGTSAIKVSAGTLNFSGALASDAAVTATVATGTANISLPAASATHLDAATRVGSVHVSGWSATVQQSGTGQSAAFDLGPQPTSTLTARVDVGTINVSTR